MQAVGFDVDRILLPTINAFLNATSTVLLLAGHNFIRKGNRDAHRRTMIAAFTTSTIFLLCYLIYHARAGAVYFQGAGIVRAVYLTILTSHTILAATVPFLAVITLRRALRGDIVKHRALARWTYPIWLYVSVTGVVVYWMLYWL